MRSLSELIKKRAEKNLKIRLDEKTVYYIFKKAIKEEFGLIGEEKFQPDYFDGKNIFIKSSSSAWLNELWSNRSRIIEKMNQELGGDLIEDIKTK